MEWFSRPGDRMKRRYRHIILSLALATVWLGNGPALAQEGLGALPELPGEGIEVVVAPSTKELDPVAIPDALCAGSGDICTSVVSILRNDLTLSGFFHIVNSDTYLVKPEDEPIDSPNWAGWFDVGAKYLIRADVRTGPEGTNLEFRLHNIVEKTLIETQNYSWKKVPKGAVRAKTHAFANSVIEVLTGQPGLFGSRIAYSAKTTRWTRGIYVMDMDGYGAKAIIADDRINALPNFGKSGVFHTSQGEGEDPQLYLSGKPFSKSPGKYRRAAQSSQGQIAVSVDTGSGSNIWLMGPSGKLTRNLTQGNGDNISPSWSPSGTQITFVSNRSGGPQIFIMNADGTGQRRLSMAGAYNSTPDFGPDGLVVFAGMDEGHSDLFTVDMSGNIRRLTQGQGSNKDPIWSPDGRWIAFVSNRTGQRIWVMSADGRHQYPISQKAGSFSTPDWIVAP